MSNLLIKLLNTGTAYAGNDDYLKGKIYLSNIIGLVTVIIAMSYANLFFWLFPPFMLYFSLVTFSLGCSIFITNAKGWHYTSRSIASLAVISLTYVIHGLLVAEGEELIPSVAIAMVGVALWPWVLADVREKKLLFPLAAINFFFISTQSLAADWFNLGLDSTIFRVPLVGVLNYVFNIIIIVPTLLSMQSRNYLLEMENGQLMSDMRSFNAEIVAQNEELNQQQEEIMAQREFIELRNKELESMNKQLGLSIRAAQNIQEAALPTDVEMSDFFREHFVLYRPKDVVSGDFYWITKQKNTNILVVSDCTGHGVPGAFMTLVGNNLLDKIVNALGVVEPSEILTLLHYEVKRMLKQDVTHNKSGMEMVVLTWEDRGEEGIDLFFSGAKNDVYIYSEKGEKLVLKGTRKSIGGYQVAGREFETQSLFVPKESFVYAFSDGFKDQNNVARRKVGSSRFESWLYDAYDQPAHDQLNRLEHKLNHFMVDTLQRDDILVLGFRV